MLKIELYDDFILNEKDLKSNSLEILLSIDCHMKVTIDDNIFYEDWTCPLEMYYQYQLWKTKIKFNRFIDFEYNTEDNGVNPILAFKHLENDKWKIDSCYKKYNEEKTFTTEQVMDFFNQYEKQLYEHIVNL